MSAKKTKPYLPERTAESIAKSIRQAVAFGPVYNIPKPHGEVKLGNCRLCGTKK